MSAAVHALDLSAFAFRLEQDLLYADLIMEAFYNKFKGSKEDTTVVILFSNKCCVLTASQLTDRINFYEYLNKAEEKGLQPIKEGFLNLIRVGLFAFRFLPSRNRKFYIYTSGFNISSTSLLTARWELFKCAQDIYRQEIDFNLVVVGNDGDFDFGFLSDASSTRFIESCLGNLDYRLTDHFSGDYLASVHFRDYYMDVDIDVLVKARLKEGFKVKSNNANKVCLSILFMPFVSVEYRIRVQEMRVDIHVITTKEFANSFIYYVKYGTSNSSYDFVNQTNTKLIEFLHALGDADDYRELMGNLTTEEQIKRAFRSSNSNFLAKSWFTSFSSFTVDDLDFSSWSKLDENVFLFRKESDFVICHLSTNELGHKVEFFSDYAFDLVEVGLDHLNFVPFEYLLDFDSNLYFECKVFSFKTENPQTLKNVLGNSRKGLIEVKKNEHYIEKINVINHLFHDTDASVEIRLYFVPENEGFINSIAKNDYQIFKKFESLQKLKRDTIATITFEELDLLLDDISPNFEQEIDFFKSINDNSVLELTFQPIDAKFVSVLESSSYFAKFFLVSFFYFINSMESSGWKLVSFLGITNRLFFINVIKQELAEVYSIKILESYRLSFACFEVSLESIFYSSLTSKDSLRASKMVELYHLSKIKGYYALLLSNYLQKSPFPIEVDLEYSLMTSKSIVDHDIDTEDSKLLLLLKQRIESHFSLYEECLYFFFGNAEKKSWKTILKEADSPLFLKFDKSLLLLTFKSETSNMVALDEVILTSASPLWYNSVPPDKLLVLINLEKDLEFIIQRHTLLKKMRNFGLNFQLVVEIESFLNKIQIQQENQNDSMVSVPLFFIRNEASEMFLNELMSSKCVQELQPDYFLVEINNRSDMEVVLKLKPMIDEVDYYVPRRSESGLGIMIESEKETIEEDSTFEDFPDHCMFIKTFKESALLYFLASPDMDEEIANKLKKCAERILFNSCHTANQKALLKELNESRHCSQYLIVPGEKDDTIETDEEDEQALHHQLSLTNLKPGMFQCALLKVYEFPLYWRLKLNQAAAFLSSNVLHPFSISNRRGIFVYADGTKIFYFSLIEQISVFKPTETPGTASTVSDSKESPITSANLKKDDNPNTLILKIYGVCELTNSFNDFIRMLHSKLHSLYVNHLAALISRNPSLKLTQQDVQFLTGIVVFCLYLETKLDGCGKKISESVVLPSKGFSMYLPLLMPCFKKIVCPVFTSFSSTELNNFVKFETENNRNLLLDEGQDIVDLTVFENVFLYNYNQVKASDQVLFGQGLALICVNYHKQDLLIKKLYKRDSCLNESVEEFLNFVTDFKMESDYFIKIDGWIQGSINPVNLLKTLKECIVLAIMESFLEWSLKSLDENLNKVDLKNTDVDKMAPMTKLVDIINSGLQLNWGTGLSKEYVDIIDPSCTIVDFVPIIKNLDGAFNFGLLERYGNEMKVTDPYYIIPSRLTMDSRSFQLFGLWHWPNFNDHLKSANSLNRHRQSLSVDTNIKFSGTAVPKILSAQEYTSNEKELISNLEPLFKEEGQGHLFNDVPFEQRKNTFMLLGTMGNGSNRKIQLSFFNVNPTTKIIVLDKVKEFAEHRNQAWLNFQSMILAKVGHNMPQAQKYVELNSSFINGDTEISLDDENADVTPTYFEFQTRKVDRLYTDVHSTQKSNNINSWLTFLHNARVFHWVRTPILLCPHEEYHILTSDEDQYNKWFDQLVRIFSKVYISYLKTFGMQILHADEDGIPYTLLEKNFYGGSLLIDVGFKNNFVSVNVYTTRTSAGMQFGLTTITSGTSTAALNDFAGNDFLGASWSHPKNLNRQLFKNFTEEASRFKNITHVNSFVYDFHLRIIRNSVLDSERHYINWEHLIKSNLIYFEKPANFCKNRFIAGNYQLKTTMNRIDMFKYVCRHPYQFGVNLLRFGREIKGCFLELPHSTSDLSYLMILYLNYSGKESDVSKWTLNYHLLVVNLNDIHPFVNKDEKASSKYLKVVPSSDSKDFLTSYVTNSSNVNINTIEAEYWIEEALKNCEKFIEQLVELAFTYYARDSLWRRLVNSLQNDETGGNLSPTSEFTLVDFLVLSTRYYTRPIVNMETTLQPYLNDESVNWNNLLDYLIKMFSQCKEFIEKRMNPPFSGKVIRHLVFLNPGSTDLLIHLAVLEDGKCVELEAVSREWREVTLKEKLHARKIGVFNFYDPIYYLPRKSSGELSTGSSSNLTGKSRNDEVERQENIEIGFVSDIIRTICFYLFQQGIKFAQ